MIKLNKYQPHEAQKAFHYAMSELYRFVALISGIRAGKTYAGAREALRQSWNAKGKGVYGIIAPTYNMLDRTTWMEFKEAARPLILAENDSKKIITLKNLSKSFPNQRKPSSELSRLNNVSAEADRLESLLPGKIKPEKRIFESQY